MDPCAWCPLCGRPEFYKLIPCSPQMLYPGPWNWENLTSLRTTVCAKDILHDKWCGSSSLLKVPCMTLRKERITVNCDFYLHFLNTQLLTKPPHRDEAATHHIPEPDVKAACAVGTQLLGLKPGILAQTPYCVFK